MNYKKFKRFVALALIGFLGVALSIYFLGGLKPAAMVNSNEDFDLTGYIDYSPYDGTGFYTVKYNSEAELNQAISGIETSRYTKTIDESKNLFSVKFNLQKSRIVAQNKDYTMFLNEDTTVVTVAVNSECAAPNGTTEAGFKNYVQSTCKTVFQSALDSGNSTEGKSNFVLYYIGSNQKLSTIGFNTYANSVLYNDLLYGTIKRHYQIKFINGGIEILYEVGDFTVINSFFPKQFDRKYMENYFRGNLQFIIIGDEVVNNSKFIYKDIAYTWSKECAAYLEDRNLATVTPVYSNDPLLDENGERIPSRYDLTNILETTEDGRILNKLKLQQGIDYNAANFNEEGASPCTTNPFLNSYLMGNMMGSYYMLQTTNGAEKDPIYYNTDFYLNTKTSSPTFVLKASSAIPYQKLFEYMYKLDTPTDPNYFYYTTESIRVTEENKDQYPGYEVGQNITRKIPVTYDDDPDDNIPGVSMPIGGFQARDEEGNFLYDENNKPVQEVFTKVLADGQNDLYGNEVESNSPIFQVAMRFMLTDKGMETTILNNSLIEGKGKNYRENGKYTQYSHDCLLGSIDVLPYMTSNNSLTSQGQIIIPDGSGAIINFNSPKDELGYTAYAKAIYGSDLAFTFRNVQTSTDNQKIMFPMYGFLDKTNKKGVLAIVDRGANQTAIYANFKRADVASTMNIANFKTILRESETVYAGTANTPFLKWSKNHINNDLKYIYQFMMPNEFIDSENNIQYVGLANKFRQYLEDKYAIEYRDMTDNTVINLNFLGAFEKREITMGFVHNVNYGLTTFDQARSIIEELMERGINDYAVSYTSWTKDAMEPKATRSVNVARVLGGKSDLKNLKKFLDENNINFYPETPIATNKGYDYAYGNLKYTAKSIGSTYALHRPYVLATGVANSTIEPKVMVSPKFYNAVATNYFKSYRRLGLNSAYVYDLGNIRIGDYSRKSGIFAENGMDYQIMALDYISTKTEYMMLSAPFDYALKYANFAVDVPLETTYLGYYDYSIPFYQLVVSGMFDYTGPAVNYNSSQSVNWNILKALETGSNLNFMVSYEDTKVLLETDYTMYFNAYFANWKSKIVYMNDVINSTKIHHLSRLVGHKILQDNVYQVEYSNGAILIINYNNTPYFNPKTGVSVRPNWFTVVQEANV